MEITNKMDVGFCMEEKVTLDEAHDLLDELEDSVGKLKADNLCQDAKRELSIARRVLAVLMESPNNFFEFGLNGWE